MNLQAFHTPEHQPFFWQGSSDAAALLIHGFPGTPAEMRPIAETLHQAGWTVQGLLLPGFGPEIPTLSEKTHDDWLNAANEAFSALKQPYQTTLLVGYSMGAALAMQTAARHAPDALIAISPFWKLGTFWQRLAGRMVAPFMKTMTPFKKANFADAKFRADMARIMPDADLDDPDTQATIRSIELPLRLFGEIGRAGQGAYNAVPDITVPTLVLQGTDDPVVWASRTRVMVRRFRESLQYEEFPTSHDIIHPTESTWPRVQQTILDFAGRLHAHQTTTPATD